MVSGTNKKLNVLVASSVSPFASAQLVNDVIKSYELNGHKVTLLTRYPADNLSNTVIHVEEEPLPRTAAKGAIKRLLPHLRGWSYYKRKWFYSGNKTSIVYLNESEPPVPVSSYLPQIKEGAFDLIHFVFLQGMFNSRSIAEMAEALNVPVIVEAVDMSLLTGGCFYFSSCRRFMHGCGQCPALLFRSDNDLTSRNFQIKKQYLSNVRAAFLGNSWMCNHAMNAPVIENWLVRKKLITVNPDHFRPRDMDACRRYFGIETNFSTVIFAFANTREYRKGFTYMLEAITCFLSGLTAQERASVMLLIVTNNKNDKRLAPLKEHCMLLNYLDYDGLANAYAAADIYLSPSVEDAGPSMINQSLSSGTPVVAFKVGVALDVIVDGETGYLAEIGDSSAFARNIGRLYRLTAAQRKACREQCRKFALEQFTYEKAVAVNESVYYELIS